MISPLDSRVMDMNAETLGVSVEFLMLNAGKAVADLVNERFPGKRVRIFCGRGNNGGDGLAAAKLIPNAKITMIDGVNMKTPASRTMAEAVWDRMEDFTGEESDFDILVDAGLGTGISGTLRDQWKKYVHLCNDFEGTIISVDVPSGFGADEQVVPDITICMVDSKSGMTEESCGEIVIADIMMPREAYEETGPGDILRYPIPSADSHKGDSGRLLVIGGGPYFGAPGFAAVSAMRCGTDMVYVATPTRTVQTVVFSATEAMIIELPGDHLKTDDVPAIMEAVEKCDAILIGPGLGLDADTVKAVLKIVSSVNKPMVIDADGITAVSGCKPFSNPNVIVTPHMGEYKRLGGIERSKSDVERVAKELGCTVLLKGPTDIISDGTHTCLNKTGCVAMTSAGTGDMLSGAVAGLLARGMSTFDAAKLAAWLIGKAGESAFAELSYGLCASDLEYWIAVELGKALNAAGR